MKRPIFLCAISNISSGSCNEDCKFCTQAVQYKADIDRYKYKEISTIVEDAKRAKANGAVGMCLVTAGKGIDDKTLAFVTKAARAVKAEVKDLLLIACNGTASITQLEALKEAGVDAYNHNLETSRSFYPTICTTHDWDERYQTCKNVNTVGLMLITGGIFGMGESDEDRLSMLQVIASLNPMSVPINFFHPNEALPITNNISSIEEAFSLVRLSREIIGNNSRIMIAGGREITFKDRQKEIFENGADAIVIGNYLTTNGEDSTKDHEMIHSLGFRIATSEDCIGS
jgi:biotin synthase